MPRKLFGADQIVPKLRQVDVLTAQGKALPQACKEAGFSDKSYYRWRKSYGALQLDQAKPSGKGTLEQENACLKRVVADLSPEKAMRKGVASGKV